jgi:hypothetical protein
MGLQKNYGLNWVLLLVIRGLQEMPELGLIIGHHHGVARIAQISVRFFSG